MSKLKALNWVQQARVHKYAQKLLTRVMAVEAIATPWDPDPYTGELLIPTIVVELCSEVSRLTTALQMATVERDQYKRDAMKHAACENPTEPAK